MGGMASAQTAGNSPQASGSSSLLAAYLQEQRSLAQEQQTLISQGATTQQMQAWWQSNAPRFQAQRQRAQALSTASAIHPMRMIRQVTIPADASPTLRDFLVSRATLANAYAQLHNQMLKALPPGASPAQIHAFELQAMQTFRKQHSRDIQLQARQSQSLAAESASRPLPIPGPPRIPRGATPQFAAYLTARNALAASHAQLWNQYLGADPTTRAAAMNQWQQQNATSLDQLRQTTQAFTNPTANPEENNP